MKVSTSTNAADLMKQSHMGGTVASFSMQLSNYTYKASMADDFIILMSVFVTPGYLEVDLDFSKFSAEAVDLKAFIAGLAKLFFMKSNQSYLNTISDESAKLVEILLVNMGTQKEILRQLPDAHADQMPFNRVQQPVGPRFVPRDLQILQTNFSGGGWMNGRGDIFSQTDLLRDTYPMCAVRPVYAVNCSDFDTFINEEG